MFGFGRKKKAIRELGFCLAEKLMPFSKVAHKLGVFWVRLEGDPYLVGFINGRIKSQLAGCKALVEEDHRIDLKPDDLMQATYLALDHVTHDPQRFVALTERAKSAPDYDRAYDDAAQIMRWYAGVDDITQEENYEGLLALAEAMQQHIEAAGLKRRDGADHLLACWAAEAQLFGLKFEQEKSENDSSKPEPQDNAGLPTSAFTLSSDNDITRFASVVSKTLENLTDPDLVNIYVARSAIDLHEQVRDEINANLDMSANTPFKEEPYNERIMRLEKKIQEADGDLFIVSKARWLQIAHALRKYEWLVAQGQVDAQDLIVFYARMADQVAAAGPDEIQNREGVFSSEEVTRACSAFILQESPGDKTEAFCVILNERIPHSAYKHPIWADITKRYGVVAASQLDDFPARDLDTVVCTKAFAENWNQSG